MLRSFVVWVWCLEKLLRLASLYPSFSPCSLECPSETQCLAKRRKDRRGFYPSAASVVLSMLYCSVSSSAVGILSLTRIVRDVFGPTGRYLVRSVS